MTLGKYIIRAYASFLADSTYFTMDDPDEFVRSLEERGWKWIECRKVTVRDKQVEGYLKRCRLGSRAERDNLRIMFNLQSAE